MSSWRTVRRRWRWRPPAARAAFPGRRPACRRRLCSGGRGPGRTWPTRRRTGSRPASIPGRRFRHARTTGCSRARGRPSRGRRRGRPSQACRGRSRRSTLRCRPRHRTCGCCGGRRPSVRWGTRSLCRCRWSAAPSRPGPPRVRRRRRRAPARGRGPRPSVRRRPSPSCSCVRAWMCGRRRGMTWPCSVPCRSRVLVGQGPSDACGNRPMPTW